MSALAIETVALIGLVALILSAALAIIGSFGYFTRRIERSNVQTVAQVARDNERTRTTVEGYWREIDRARDDVVDAKALYRQVLDTLNRSA